MIMKLICKVSINPVCAHDYFCTKPFNALILTRNYLGLWFISSRCCSGLKWCWGWLQEIHCSCPCWMLCAGFSGVTAGTVVKTLVGQESEPSVLCCQQKCREDKDIVARLLSFVLQHPSKPYFVNGNQIKLSNITAAMSLPNDDGLK